MFHAAVFSKNSVREAEAGRLLSGPKNAIGPSSSLFLGAVVRVQGQRHHERFVLILAGQVNFQCETNDYGQPGNELGHPQADGWHQHQAVRAESFDPETARAVTR